MSYWYCPNCKIELDGCHVTLEEVKIALQGDSYEVGTVEEYEE